MVTDIANMKTSVQQLVTDVAANTSAVNTLKTETSKAIDDIVELQRAVNASRYDALVKIACTLYHFKTTHSIIQTTVPTLVHHQ